MSTGPGHNRPLTAEALLEICAQRSLPAAKTKAERMFAFGITAKWVSGSRPKYRIRNGVLVKI